MRARLPSKVNAVLLPETTDQIIPLAELAQTLPVDVRFIERMPLARRKPAKQRLLPQRSIVCACTGPN